MKTKNYITKEGSIQKKRYPEALEFDYASVEERSAQELITFANNLAQYLRFYNDNGDHDGDWSLMFAPGVDTILKYVEDPSLFAVDPDADPVVRQKQSELLEALSRPHLALFLAFVQILRHPIADFKDLTRRHLDFFYKDVLRLTKKPAVSDSVHLIFKLAAGLDEHPLEKNALVKAGQDSLGKDIFYEILNTIMVNTIEVASVKTLRVVQDYISLNRMREADEKGFDLILRWALGKDFQGDELPRYPSGGINDTAVNADDLLTKYVNNDIDENYVINHLCFLNMNAFNYCMDVFKRAEDPFADYPSKEEWLEVSAHIEQAYSIKIRQHRRNILKEEQEQNGFDAMVRSAFGEPRQGDELPPMPGVEDTLDTLYTTLIKTPENDEEKVHFALAARYVTEFLYLSVSDFKKIIEVKKGILDDWDSVYSIVEQAQSLKQGLTTPAPGRWKTRHLIAASVADSAQGAPVEVSRFETFGKAKEEPEPSLYYAPGIAIASPLLRLKQGKRNIMLSLACLEQDFPVAQIKELINRDEPVFDVFLSGEKDWTKVDHDFVAIEAGDVISGQPVSIYEREELYLVCKIADSDADTIKFVLLEDGSFWEVLAASGEPGKFRLQYKEKMIGTWSARKMTSLELEGTPLSLDGLRLLEERNEIVADGTARGGASWFGGPLEDAVEREYFHERDIGKFMVWTDGRVYAIEQVMSAGRIKVLYSGKLPGYSQNVPKKYDQISFAGSSPLKNFLIEGLGFAQDINRSFSYDDIGRLLVLENGLIVKIENLQSEGTYAQVTESGEQSPLEPGIRKYDSFKGLRFKVTLEHGHPAVVPPGAYGAPLESDNSRAVMKITLCNRMVSEYGVDRVESAYEYFESVRLHQAKLEVAVQDYTDFKASNDSSSVDTKKPFEPFGHAPKPGASLYFSSKELAQKKLDTLELRLQWMGLPISFEENYRAYSLSGLPHIPEIDEQSFQARLSLLNNGSWIDIEWPKPLFVAHSKDTEACYMQYSTGLNRSSYTTLAAPPDTESDDPFEYERYFKLELEKPDFQHDRYPLVMTKIASSTNEALKSLTVYPPYTPNIKKMSINYTASTIIEPSSESAGGLHKILHLHPFGYRDIDYAMDADDSERGAPLMPQYRDYGYLFLGLANARPTQNVSILLQLIPGSGDADTEPPVIQWKYLSTYQWKDFEQADILSDQTNGLMDSGIISFRLPEDASHTSPLMPQGMHWIQAAAKKNVEAAPEIRGIHTQAVEAVFTDRDNAADHLEKPLPPQTAVQLASYNSAIESISQPYPSFGGRMLESDRTFYTRVSELLRHRGRALAPWDWERIVLENFTEIYQAKCLIRSEQDDESSSGHVALVVVPDISHTLPTYALEPKAPVSLLAAIKTYLTSLASSFANITVQNPGYEQIIYRVAVRFNPGYGQGYYTKQLSEDIKRFLSPWAYEEGAEVALGGTVYTSSLIYFLEKQPYIDYVANVKLFEQKTLYEGTDDEETRWRVEETGIAQTKKPDAILVSVPDHVVDVITTDTYREEDFAGLGYMVVGLDFFVK